MVQLVGNIGDCDREVLKFLILRYAFAGKNKTTILRF